MVKAKNIFIFKHLCKVLVIPSMVLTFFLSHLFNGKILLHELYQSNLPFDFTPKGLMLFTIVINTIISSLLIWGFVLICKNFRQQIYLSWFVILVLLNILSIEIVGNVMVSVFDVNMHDNEEGLNAAFNMVLISFFYLLGVSAIVDVYLNRNRDQNDTRRHGKLV